MYVLEDSKNYCYSFTTRRVTPQALFAKIINIRRIEPTIIDPKGQQQLTYHVCEISLFYAAYDLRH